MSLADSIAAHILSMLDNPHGTAEIQRNELAALIGCVPSQINYVLDSRFTPEQGYRVESRRGGGGYIRITRVRLERDVSLMHLINAIGDTVDAATVRAMLTNAVQHEFLPLQAAQLMLAALSEQNFKAVPADSYGKLRAAMLKNMLLTTLTP